MSKASQTDLIGGLLVALIGALALLYALAHYPLGTARNMGPGFFPAGLGSVTVIVGLIIVASSFKGPTPSPDIAWRAAFWVYASVIGFIAGLVWFGLIPAVVITVVLSSLAEEEARPLEIVASSVAISILCWLIFTVGLGMTVPLFKVAF